MRFWTVRRNFFARNEVRSSKAGVKLRFWVVRRKSVCVCVCVCLCVSLRVCVCVCDVCLSSVCVWNIWIDVKLLPVLQPDFQTLKRSNSLSPNFAEDFMYDYLSNHFISFQFIAGGLEPICLSSPTKLWHFGGWVVWSTTCTCNFPISIFSVMATG